MRAECFPFDCMKGLIRREPAEGGVIKGVISPHPDYSPSNPFLKSALEPVLLTRLLLYFLNTYI